MTPITGIPLASPIQPSLPVQPAGQTSGAQPFKKAALGLRLQLAHRPENIARKHRRSLHRARSSEQFPQVVVFFVFHG